jgi:hypothetical protein
MYAALLGVAAVVRPTVLLATSLPARLAPHL